MPERASGKAAFFLLPALAMSLGWALRGFIGGGPLGAMIPGALVAMALARLWKLPNRQAAYAAAFGALGVGFGGEMTYGQTVGFAGQPQTMAFGLLGLAVKGGIWGLLGGGVLALGATLSSFSKRRLAAAFILMVAACATGWKLVNEPKWIYLSNLADRPREEVWAGLLAASITLLLALRSPLVTRFSAAAAAGGFVGFGGGGLFIALHRVLLPSWTWFPSWKLMEYTFGFCFGLALAAAAWSEREKVQRGPEGRSQPPPVLASFLGCVCALFLAVVLTEALPGRFNFLIVGAALLLLLLWMPWLNWHVALTMTFACFSWDLAENVCERLAVLPMLWGWAFVAVSSLAFWLAVDRRMRRSELGVNFAFPLLLLTSLAVATLKTLAQVAAKPYFPAEYPLFLITAAAVIWLHRRMVAE